MVCFFYIIALGLTFPRGERYSGLLYLVVSHMLSYYDRLLDDVEACDLLLVNKRSGLEIKRLNCNTTFIFSI